jgi:hypothetical protein
LRRVRPDAVILGNSRAEIGFDPRHPAWARHASAAFNMAVPGSGIESTWTNLQRAIEVRPPTLVVVGLDLLDFVGDFDTAPPAAFESREETPLALLRRFQSLFTLSALGDSARTLAIQRDPFPAVLTDRGFNPLLDYVPIARREGYYSLFRQRAEDTARIYLQHNHALHAYERPDSSPRRALDLIIDRGSAGTRTLHLVIYPYHAQMMVLLDETGMWPAFEGWKRMLARSVSAARARRPDARIFLWDFSGFNPYTTEAIPGEGDLAATTEYYWEAGHFKKALGDRVLDRILARPDATGDWGSELTVESVDSDLERTRAGLARYAASHPDVVRDVRRIVAEQCRRLGADRGGEVCWKVAR